jgi:hypothetical protein
LNQRDPWEDLLAQIGGQNRHDPHDQLVRQIVRLRARDGCEYCLHPTIGQFQIDHIVPHAWWREREPNQAGPDHLSNFAWSCPFCNTAKGKQVARHVGAQDTRLFNPRLDRWLDHFTFMHRFLFIVGLTPIGIATQFALGFNEGGIGGPLGTRHEGILVGHYPPMWFAQRGQF